MAQTIDQVPIEGTPEISKYKFTCDKPISKDIPVPLPGSREGMFRMAVIGKSGSGKTNLVRNLTEKAGPNRVYNKKFENVFYISPSCHTLDNKPKLPEDRFYKSIFDLPEIIDRIQTDDDLKGRTLLILDDVSHELKSAGQNIIKRLFQNNRHLGVPIEDEEGNVEIPGSVSVIIIAQRVVGLPRVIRAQITHWVLFDPRSVKSELETVFKEFIYCNKGTFNEILRLVYNDDPYAFLFIDTTRSKMYNCFNVELVVHCDQYL